MSNILRFPVKRAKRKRTRSRSMPGEVVIFTGVRFERRDFDAVRAKTKAPRPRRRIRQQAVELQED